MDDRDVTRLAISVEGETEEEFVQGSAGDSSPKQGDLRYTCPARPGAAQGAKRW